MNKKCIIAMSGGVDSSVAAFLMKEKGYECIGATMKLYDNEEIGISREKTCCSLDDIEEQGLLHAVFLCLITFLILKTNLRKKL